jgi:hypothetical protein
VFSPWHKNTNFILIDTSEPEDDFGKVSKLAALYTEKDTPTEAIRFILSHVLSLNMKEFFVICYKGGAMIF